MVRHGCYAPGLGPSGEYRHAFQCTGWRTRRICVFHSHDSVDCPLAEMPIRQCHQSHRYTYHACLPRVVRYSDIKGLSLLDSTRVYPIYTNYYRDSSTRVTLPSQHHRNHSDACACLMHDSVRDSFVWRLNRTAGANQAACCHHHYRAVAAAASKRRLIVFWGSKYYYYYILGYYIILGY